MGTRNYPLVIGAAVALLLLALIGAAAITGVLPSSKDENALPLFERTAASAAARKTGCKTCGVVASVKTIGVQDEGRQPAPQRKIYRVTVRMDDGSERTLSLASAPAFSIGARVRVNGHLLERG